MELDQERAQREQESNVAEHVCVIEAPAPSEEVSPAAAHEPPAKRARRAHQPRPLLSLVRKPPDHVSYLQQLDLVYFRFWALCYNKLVPIDPSKE